MKSKKNPPKNKGSVESITLSIRIQPRASKNEIAWMENGGLKIRLTAPPVDGAANEALIRFLANTLSVARSQVDIVSGLTSRDKIVRISGVGNADAERLLNIKEKRGNISHKEN
ncbi:MAG TPA: DUF167 domain-containing protein [Nitrospirota bacterium]|nr:DUF167 domain-containing protein [Nitrospirota bacterium]